MGHLEPGQDVPTIINAAIRQSSINIIIIVIHRSTLPPSPQPASLAWCRAQLTPAPRLPPPPPPPPQAQLLVGHGLQRAAHPHCCRRAVPGLPHPDAPLDRGGVHGLQQRVGRALITHAALLPSARRRYSHDPAQCHHLLLPPPPVLPGRARPSTHHVD